MASPSPSPQPAPRLRIETVALEETFTSAGFGNPRASDDFTDSSFLHVVDDGGWASNKSASARSRRSPGRVGSGAEGVQRLLWDTLQEIRRRPKAPTAFESLASKASNSAVSGVTSPSMLSVMPSKISRQASSMTLDIGEDSPNTDGFSSETAFDLVARLNNILDTELKVNASSGGSSRPSLSDERPSGPSKLRRISFQSRQRSQPSIPSSSSEPSDAFDQLLAVLAELVHDDGRHTINGFRPSRPPNALQAALIKLAEYLINKYGNDPAALMRIGLSMIPAFYSFPASMHPLLLMFFTRSVLGRVAGFVEQERPRTDVTKESNQGEMLSADFNNDNSRSSIAINVLHSEDDEFAEKPTAPPLANNVTSLNDPGRDSRTYFSAALIPPLLAAVMECLDLHRLPQGSANPVDILFLRLMELKADIYSDLLMIIAYQKSARRSAISFLMFFWPRSTGHICEAEDLARQSVDAAVNAPAPQPHHVHIFRAWQFDTLPSHTLPFLPFTTNACHVCRSNIEGHGLLCTLCMCAVHVNCYDYPQGCYDSHTIGFSTKDNQKVVQYRFCEDHTTGLLDSQTSSRLGDHRFTPVHVFTLTLCSVCQLPTWSFSETMKCGHCHQFAHLGCLTSPRTSVPACQVKAAQVTIDANRLAASFVEGYQDMILTPFNITQKTFEETCAIHAVFTLQLSALERGMSCNTLIITGQLEHFALHHTIELCRTQPLPSIASLSPALGQYLDEQNGTRPSHLLFFAWSFLTHITVLLKSPIDDLPSHNLLSVQEEGSGDDDTADLPQSYQHVSLAYVLYVLDHELYIRSEPVARALVSHLHASGFLDLQKNEHTQINHRFTLLREDARLVFPVPFGIDHSYDVETLFATIEGCLNETNLSLNEFALLLLTRKAWPSGLSTTYALHRLASATVKWIIAKTELLREALKTSDSGLRPPGADRVWPTRQSTAQTVSGSRSGGSYVNCREALMTRYAVPWLFALYELDKSAYPVILYDVCLESAEQDPHQPPVAMSGPPVPTSASRVIRFIAELWPTPVMFDSYDDLLAIWFTTVDTSTSESFVFPSLKNIFSSPESTSRSSSAGLLGSATMITSKDPWRLFSRSDDFESTPGLESCINHLAFISKAGVACPMDICMQVALAVLQHTVSTLHRWRFAEVMLRLAFTRTASVTKVQQAIGQINVQDVKDLKSPMMNVKLLSTSLTTILVLAGCDVSLIIASGMMQSQDIPNSGRQHARETGNTFVDLDHRMLETLGQHIELGQPEVCRPILLFMDLYMCQLAELPGADHWVAAHCRMLTDWIWSLYGLQDPNTTAVRRRVLCRILHVDATPFRDVMQETFKTDAEWTSQVEAVTKLSSMVLDIIDPAIDELTRRWREHASDVLESFFSALWSSHEEVRIMTEGLKATLLPSHLSAISAFWNEGLPRSTVPNRLKTISFLLQLRPHTHRWQLLSWDCIRVLLQDTGFQPLYRTTSSAVPTDSIELQLHSATLLLTLQLIGAGYVIPLNTVQAIKLEFARFLGFRETSTRFRQLETISEQALPCVDELVNLIDAYYLLDQPSSGRAGTEEDTSVSVGGIFTEMALAVITEIRDLLDLPMITQRNLISCMLIILNKHDLEHRSLQYLQNDMRQALRRLSVFLPGDVAVEVQQLALSVWAVSVRHWSHLMTPNLLDFYANSLMDSLQKGTQNGDEASLKQLRSLLTAILLQHPVALVLHSVLQRIGEEKDAMILSVMVDGSASSKPGLVLLSEGMRKVSDVSSAGFPSCLLGMHKCLDALDQGLLPLDLLQSLASYTVSIANRISTTNAASQFETLFKFVHHLVRHPDLSQDMWSSLDAVLRVALIRSPLTVSSLQIVADMIRAVKRTAVYATDTGRAQVVITLGGALSDGLTCRKSLHAQTLVSIVKITGLMEENIISDGPQSIANGLTYLSASCRLPSSYRPSIDMLLAVGQWVLHWSELYPQVFTECLKSFVQLDLRSWNLLLLAALNDPGSTTVTSLLLDHFSIFSLTYGTMIQPRPTTTNTSSLASDVKHAYISIKLWLLLLEHSMLCDASKGNDDEHSSIALRIWSECWPPLEAFASYVTMFNDGTVALRSVLLVVKPSRTEMLAFIGQMHSVMLDVTARIGVDELTQSMPLDRSTAWRQRVARALAQLTNQDRIEAAEGRLMEQQGMVR